MAGLTLFVLFLSACDLVDTEDSSDDGELGDWLIPSDEIFDGGPGQDGIPSIEDPEFERADNTDYVSDNRLVVGIRIGDDIRAYPHQIMDHHEIVNDHIDDKAVAVTYCPLTGTGIGWDREINGTETEFGVSGMLFRNNLIAFDRETESYWPQMQLRSAHGDFKGLDIETYKVVETTWETWSEMYPDSEVITTETGFDRNYNTFVYGGDYDTNDDRILFPIANQDDRLPNKERVHGVIGDRPADEDASVTAYVIDEFAEGIELIEDQVGTDEYIIAGSSGHNIATAFERELEDGSRPEFQPVLDELPVIMEDEQGNRWDLFGVAVDGPRAGESLIPATSYTGYFFAWADFFPDMNIYEH